eukprot:CAMPEP_0181195530 /NCGR_PEP_ID=MMETSP1096-20121128/14942_1 /TAXON_ID=156174 ORGANISM="Chrysochromulina ericina, Strain CCMP281" /NCGR_SAMPLE_ID=MMETSP1096 /ASSEMBLY_ACC=CAM_ASM_000453 /LENGTH=114 /DNA_ID=CAMNT_0023285151 /DNA_START=391 /DNA_END=735 /DNA_ORIENTATION=+
MRPAGGINTVNHTCLSPAVGKPPAATPGEVSATPGEVSRPVDASHDAGFRGHRGVASADTEDICPAVGYHIRKRAAPAARRSAAKAASELACSQGSAQADPRGILRCSADRAAG